MTVRAARNFVCHREGQHRTFVRNEVIPEDWVPFVKLRRHLDSDADHLPTLDEELAEIDDKRPASVGTVDQEIAAAYEANAAGRPIDAVIAWVLDTSQPGDKVLRAVYARRVEGEAEKPRSGALTALGEIISDTPPTIAVSGTEDPEADDPSAG